MRINLKKESKFENFGDLKEGDFFKHGAFVYKKIPEVTYSSSNNERAKNAIALIGTLNSVHYFNKTHTVLPVDIEIEVKEKNGLSINNLDEGEFFTVKDNKRLYVRRYCSDGLYNAVRLTDDEGNLDLRFLTVNIPISSVVIKQDKIEGFDY